MQKFNINDYMFIQINEQGWEYLKQTVGDDYIDHCIKNNEVVCEGQVWYKLQCHEVFSLLPIKFNKVLFNTNVMFDIKNQ